MPKQGSKMIGESTKIELATPCGIYCGACYTRSLGKYAGCIRENREAPKARIKQCRFYKCAIVDQGLSSCSSCGKFPCRMLQRFRGIQAGKEVRYYRHVTIDNLRRRKEIGLDVWLVETEERANNGEYYVGLFDAASWQQGCACMSKNTTNPISK